MRRLCAVLVTILICAGSLCGCIQEQPAWTVSPTEPSVQPSTEPTTEPTTEPSTEPTTEPVTQPTEPVFTDTSWRPADETETMSYESYFAERREFQITNTPYRSVWGCDLDGDTVAWMTGYGLDYAEGFVVLEQNGTNTYRTDGRRVTMNTWTETPSYLRFKEIP